MVLTYVAIVSTYVPFLVKGMDEQRANDAKAAAAAAPASPAAAGAPAAPQAPAAVEGVVTFVVMAGVVIALPFLAGFGNFMGWLIIGFAVYQAWKMNRKRVLAVTGPFRLASANGPAAAAVGAEAAAAAPAPA